MKLSIYFYLFNAEIREFELDKCIDNFCSFADEVVCSTIPSQDNTLTRLKKHESDKGKDRFKVIETNILLSNNRFDGLLKTAALQGCSKDKDRLYCIADADELFVQSNRTIWEDWARLLLKSPLDGLLIPVIDLFGNRDSIRSDKEIGQKFRLHKNTVVARGVIPQAEFRNGYIDHTISDTTEPLNFMGQLANFQGCVSSPDLMPIMSFNLVKTPYVLHEGFLDLNRRAKINKEFWKEKWQHRTQNEINDIIIDAKEFQGVKTIKHNLPLE